MNKKIFFMLLLPISLVMNGSDDDSFFENIESQSATAHPSVQQNYIQTNNVARVSQSPRIDYGFNDNSSVQNNGQIVQCYQRSIHTNHINSGPIGRNVKNNQNNSGRDSAQEKRLVRRNMINVFFNDNGEIVDGPNAINNASSDNNNLDTPISDHFVTTGPVQLNVTYQIHIPTNHLSLGAIGRNVKASTTNRIVNSNKQNNNLDENNLFDMHESSNGDFRVSVYNDSSKNDHVQTTKETGFLESPIEHEGSPVWSFVAGIDDNLYVDRLSNAVESRNKSTTETNQATDSQPSLGAHSARTPSFIYKTGENSVGTPVIFVEHPKEIDSEHSQRYGSALGELHCKEDIETIKLKKPWEK